MDRTQFERLIELAEEGFSWEQDQATPREKREHESSRRWEKAEEAITVAKEELSKWPTEDEIDETPRIPLAP